MQICENLRTNISPQKSKIVHDNVIIINGDLPETMQIAELSLKALNHVFIAKIDNLNFVQLQSLKKIAEESGVVLQLGTGYKYCSVYNMLNEAALSAKVVEIKHQLVYNNNFFISLINDFDFVTSLLNVGINKYNVKSWNNSENFTHLLHCILECYNGCLINATFYTIDEGTPKLEIGFITSETIYSVDIFEAKVKKQKRSGDTIENITLDTYCEKSIFDNNMQNFNRAISNDLEALRTIDNQFQNIIIANSIIERFSLNHGRVG